MAISALIGALRVNLGIDTAAFQDGLRGVQKSLRRVGRRLQRTGQDLSLKVSAPLAAIGGLSLKAFSDFEKGLIGVGKTTDITGEQLAELGRGVQGIARDVPVATTELLGIAQAAGQLGVTGNENILRFTETVGKLGISTNLAGEEAATALARILTVTGTALGDVDRLGSVFVRLGNNFAATEAEISEAATRVAQATAQFGASAADVAGVATALTAVGVRAEAGGTVINRAFQSINDAVRQGGDDLRTLADITGRTADELRSLFAEDPTRVFEALVTGLGRIGSEGGDVTAALESLGLSGVRVNQVLGTLATRSEVLTDALAQSRDEWEQNIALNNEAATATESFAAQTQLARNALNEASTALGRALAPAANDLLSALAGLARWFSQLNPDVLKFGAIVGGLVAVIGPVLIVVGLLATGIAAIGLPIAGVIAGIGLLAAGIIAFWDDVEPVVTAVGAGFKQLWQNIINDIERVKRAFEDYKTFTKNMIDQTRTMVEKIDGFMGGRLKAAWQIAVDGFKVVEGAAQKMSDAIVGNSIIPDMVDAVIDEFERMGSGIRGSTRDTMTGVESDFSGMSQSIGNEITGPLKNSFKQGELNFSSFADTLVSVGNRLRDRLLDQVFRPIEDALSELLGGFVSGIFGGGGSSAPATSPIPVPRFQHGGSFIVGGAGGIDRNLVQFRASRGERVDITPAGKIGGGSGNVNVEVINNTGAPVSQDRQQTPDGQRVRIIIGEMVAEEMNRPGSAVQRALSTGFGARPVTRRR